MSIDDLELRALIEDVIERRAPASNPARYPKTELRKDLEGVSDKIDVRKAAEKARNVAGRTNSVGDKLAKALDKHGLLKSRKGKTPSEIARLVEKELNMEKKSFDTLLRRVLRHYKRLDSEGRSVD